MQSRKQFEKLTDDYKLFDCIECGCCSYVCPSNIPLVQYYRYAKSEIRDQLKSSEVADIARERNEFRLYRLERRKKNVLSATPKGELKQATVTKN